MSLDTVHVLSLSEADCRTLRASDTPLAFGVARFQVVTDYGSMSFTERGFQALKNAVLAVDETAR